MLYRFHGALATLVLAIVPAWSWATCAREADGSDACASELIRLLDVTQAGDIYVMPTSSLAPASTGFSCAPVLGQYLVLNSTASNFKSLYAALLSARIVGAPVTLVMDRMQAACTIAYALL
jgi:hypothetical protein